MHNELSQRFDHRPQAARRAEAQTRRYQAPPTARPRITLRTAAKAVTTWAIRLVALGLVAVIVWLWLQGGGISGIHNLGTLFTTAGRITGLVGAYLLLVQVLLLARLPF